MPTPPDTIAPPSLTLDGVVAWWADRRPGAMALEYPDDAVSWSQFDCCIQGAAEDLSGVVTMGEAVGVVCEDSVDLHVLINALWRRGAAVLLIDRGWGVGIVSDLLRLTGCRTVFRPAASTVGDASGVAIGSWPVRRESDVRGASSDPDAVALYASTSGTTDNPKCVAISHRRIRSAYRACLTVHDLSGVRRAASLFQINSLGVLGVCFLLPREVGGGTQAFASFSIANVSRSWSRILEGEIDFVYLVPPLVRLLNRLPAAPATIRRLVAFCAAAPVQRDELRMLEARFPVTVFNSYGLTELTFAVFFGCRDDDGLASDSIGWPVGIQARLIDENGHEPLGPGRGELQISGPMLTDGYLDNPTATAESWSGGWLRTGDIAERDDQGRYFIRGRQKDIVLRGGVTCYLFELEHYLRRAPQVVDACAFRGRDLPSGEELCVVVQTAGPVAPDVILDWVRTQMGETRVPNALFLLREALPRNSNGKVMRPVLEQMYRDGQLASTAS